MRTRPRQFAVIGFAAVGWYRGNLPVARSLLTYSQSSNPSSPLLAGAPCPLPRRYSAPPSRMRFPPGGRTPRIPRESTLNDGSGSGERPGPLLTSEPRVGHIARVRPSQ